MAETYKYKRVLLKLSGEALAGESGFGLDGAVLESMTRQIHELVDDGIQLGIVIGGGNYFRGATGALGGMDRGQADYMGMLATVMNSIALADAFTRAGIPTRPMSALDMPQVIERYIRLKALDYLDQGKVVICGGGAGNPFFTTDTTGALRACELKCDCLMKATKVDGIYSADPVKDPTAVHYDRISYKEVLNQGLKVMDASAISICMDNHMPLVVFNMFEEGNIKRALQGQAVGTVVE